MAFAQDKPVLHGGVPRAEREGERERERKRERARASEIEREREEESKRERERETRERERERERGPDAAAGDREQLDVEALRSSHHRTPCHHFRMHLRV